MLSAMKQGGITQVNQLLANPELVAEITLDDLKETLIVAIREQRNDVVLAILQSSLLASMIVRLGQELLNAAAYYGNKVVMNALLSISSIQNMAHENNNHILNTAIGFGHIDVVRALLALPAVKEIAHQNENHSLHLAIKLYNQEIALMLLALPEVKNIAHQCDNALLIEAANIFHVEIVKCLLKLPEVKSRAHIQDNYVWLWATRNNCLEVIKSLIAIENVKNSIDIDETLELAIKFSNVKIFEYLLSITFVQNYILRDAGSHFRDFVNKYARHKTLILQLMAKGGLPCAIARGDLGVVKNLFSIPNFEKFVDLNAILNLANSYHNKEIFKFLLRLPTVKQLLLHNQGRHLAQYFNVFSKFKQTILDGLTIYGLTLKHIIGQDDVSLVQEYIYAPIPFLKKRKMSPVIIEAVKIIYLKELVEKYKRQKAALEHTREHNENVDDETCINEVRSHFETQIKPYFQKQYDHYSYNNQQSLANIEIEIRKLLLETIREDAAQKQAVSPRAAAIVQYIDSLDLDKESKDHLLAGNNEQAMSVARSLFCDTTDDAQTAWRAYDPFAPVGGKWPNLLTEPLKNANKGVYTVNAVGLQEPTEKMASDLSREMVAFSYLLVTDKSDGDEATHATRIRTFIAKIAEIRRAHNVSPSQVDDPSCLPGTITRIGDMWQGHSKAVIPDIEMLLQEELRPIVLEKFQQIPKDMQESFYNALVMLSGENALEVINGKCVYSDKNVIQRQKFMNRFGSFDGLMSILDSALKKRGIFLDSKILKIFQLNLLSDIGGAWIIESLTNTYRKGREEQLENPYQYYMDSQSANTLPKQQALQLMRKALQALPLEGKNALMFQAADQLAANNLVETRNLLEKARVPNEVIKDIEHEVQALIIRQQNTCLKAKLWEMLREELHDTNIEEKGDILREMVSTVIDNNQPLATVLQAKNLPVAESVLIQYSRLQTPENGTEKGKRKKTPEEGSAKRLRFD